MKILYSWLKDFIDINEPPEKIAEKIFIHSLNVKEIEDDRKSGDAVFDIELTPDRGDCLSHLGIARELSAIYNKKLKIPIKAAFIESDESRINVEVKDKNLCQQYTARVITSVQIKESPAWLKERLAKIGEQSINNVVDITNYIMHSYGQPMHAFDFDKIKDKKIIVRAAKKNEKMIDIDNKSHILNERDLIISDNEKPIAIAGIFGSLDSGISANTKNIVLESASFDSINVRLTSKRLNLSTEASYRFERGTDIDMTKTALNLATQLILNEAGGRPCKKIDICPEPKPKVKIKLDYKKISVLLGTKIAIDQINKILAGLGFEVKDNHAIIPSWRNDIKIFEDLVEEIGRIYGYDNFSKKELSAKKFNNKGSAWFQKELVKDQLVQMGLTEVYNYSFVSEEDLSNFRTKKELHNKLVNPLSPECAYMRPNLIIGLVKTVAKNPSFDPIEIFEIGEVFRITHEYTELAIALSGNRARKIDDIVASLAKSFNISPQIIKNKSKIVTIEKSILAKYKIRKSNIIVLTVSIKNLLQIAKLTKDKINLSRNISAYKEISKYPSVQRDIAIIVERKILSESIRKEILNEEMAKTVECFDEYISDKFGTGKKSLAFRISYASVDRTLNKEEVSLIQKKILLNIKNKFGAKLRS